jgi:hypothetical protein
LDIVPGDQLPELEGRLVFRDLNNLIVRSLGDQTAVPCENDTTLLAAEIDQLKKTSPFVIQGIITQKPQVFGEFSQHSVNQELHKD